MARGPAVRVVVSPRPDSQHYDITLEPAPMPSPFVSSIGRSYRRLVGDRSWWVTVRRDDLNWPVLKERHATHELAAERVDAIASSIASGDLCLTRPVVLRTSARSV